MAWWFEIGISWMASLPITQILISNQGFKIKPENGAYKFQFNYLIYHQDYSFENKGS
jgi:hypothetical protein